MSLEVEQAKRFFGSLYDESVAPDLGAFEGAAIRLVARVSAPGAVAGKDVAAGDKALGVLMLNHVMTTPEVDSGAKTALTAAALMNIKSEVVAKFTELFPEQNLNDLIESARAQGYQVDVLDPGDAKSLPRTVVGR
ncbi:hypothetical protein [Nocardia wallacei]|uniref:Uncharacterized protein n=1 Tax=Nocardia wallacei TaxID=480035 RepID=A0A7G1KLP0_9NOCA|nr:hypothetical protein [Nocardia wallacei]BCK54899.1 hypothetical protein NWFMUON74_26710 [Nocardia wallacei]